MTAPIGCAYDCDGTDLDCPHPAIPWDGAAVRALHLAITCPRCGMTSANPNDIREGYCGNCHDWTGRPA